MKKAADLIKEINAFKPQDGVWLKLDHLLNQLWQTGEQEKFTAELLQVFERFPEDDGAGVLWSIVHGIEGFKDYDQALLDSLNRQPSEMGLIMLRRIKNSGADKIAGIAINKAAKDLFENPRTPESLKDDIEDLL